MDSLRAHEKSKKVGIDVRKNQISVRIYKVPICYDIMTKEDKFHFQMKADAGRSIHEKKDAGLLSVYADGNDFYQAYCAAYHETVLEIQRKPDFGKPNEQDDEHFTGEVEVHVIIHYSELMHPFLGKSISFTAISENVYKALTNAFNDVLHELLKHRKISYGRKEHYPGADTRVKIYACHAGTGKTTLAKEYPDKFVDFVCMPYKHHPPEEFDENEGEACKANSAHQPNWDYPHNYFEAIRAALAKSDKILLIPPDPRLLYLLRTEDIPYLLCYPENTKEAKEVYRKRFVDRGNSEDFLDIFIGEWQEFMHMLEIDQYGHHIVMKPKQFLIDAVCSKHPEPENRALLYFYR